MADKRAAEGTLSLISANTFVEGKLTTEGSVRIDGKLVGDIIAKANVAIGLTGTVEGSVAGNNIALAGRVKGHVTAVEKLILESKSIMRGDIRALKLVVDEGATFDGHCGMSKPEAEHGRPGGHQIP
jgi:cytoskeletal protein CcmA (bactofilin family)